jgi:hypothetical protein
MPRTRYKQTTSQRCVRGPRPEQGVGRRHPVHQVHRATLQPLVPLSVRVPQQRGIQLDIQGDGAKLHVRHGGIWQSRPRHVGIPRLARSQGVEGGHCQAGRRCCHVRRTRKLPRHVPLLFWVCAPREVLSHQEPTNTIPAFSTSTPCLRSTNGTGVWSPRSSTSAISPSMAP